MNTHNDEAGLEMVILIGLQASGKSTFFQTYFTETHQHVSKDLLRPTSNPARRQHQLIAEALQAGRSVVVDNTNATRQDRQELLHLARGYGARVTGYYFEPRLKQSLEYNRMRQGRARVPDVAIFTTLKRLARPSLDEGFDQLFSVRALDHQTFEVRAWKEEAMLDEQPE